MSITTSLKKATRAVEKSVTGTDPGKDLLDTLKEEHEEVSDLLKKLVDSNRAVERKSLLKQIKAALVPHARAEEKVLYNAILDLKDNKANIDGEEGYIEHSLADKTLAMLGKIENAMSPEFSAGSKVLKELITHHVKEEESNVWSDAKEHFDSAKRVEMNTRYLALKKTVKIPA
jgi:hemerythrin superfamily protein